MSQRRISIYRSLVLATAFAALVMTSATAKADSFVANNIPFNNVKISGIVRPFDIAANNTVPSTKVADATIIYTGEGAEADAGKIGWLARFFVSALFPF